MYASTRLPHANGAERTANALSWTLPAANGDAPDERRADVAHDAATSVGGHDARDGREEHGNATDVLDDGHARRSWADDAAHDAAQLHAARYGTANDDGAWCSHDDAQ